ncbi:MAG: hypothetical protein MPW15_16155 [Candidatus Manganitrophus sp.]|nr:hypothetical protein [Candidatus Manganitrophus sp.]
MTKKSFEGLVRKAIDRIPSEFQEAMKNIAILIEDRPGPEAEDLMTTMIRTESSTVFIRESRFRSGPSMTPECSRT